MSAKSAGRASKRPRSEKNLAFWLASFVVVPFMKICAHFEWIDGDKVPATGAFVLAPNHYSNLDPIVISYALWKFNRVPRFLAKASLFDIPVIGRALHALGQIPLERPNAAVFGDATAMAAARDLVEKGRAVIVYPEGTLTRDPDLWPMRGKNGAVRLALQHDLPLIPVVHWGTQTVMPRYKNSLHIFPRKTITIKYGDPVDLSEYRGRPLDGKMLNAATAKLMAAITELLESVRGEKAPHTPWNPRRHDQNETGKF
jgi:1-acyl-sn-glycerol-3-phosphate acyltransferase